MLQHAAALEPILFPHEHYPPGVGQNLIEQLANFYSMISCGYVLIIEKFAAFANFVDGLLRTVVKWHPGVPSIHLNIIQYVFMYLLKLSILFNDFSDELLPLFVFLTNIFGNINKC